MHATDHRRQMRRENEAHLVGRHFLQARFRFRMMAMTGYTVSLEVIARFGEQVVDFGFFACARYARCAIGNQVTGIDDACF